MRGTAAVAIGVAGCGHFGRFHALKVAEAADARLAGVCDPDAARAAAVGSDANARVLAWPDLLDASEAVIIAAPVAEHFRLAQSALRAGRHVLVEKPIAATPAEADVLANLATRTGCVLQVGHLERFSAAFQALAALKPRPLYIEAIRAAPFKLRGTDVSVVLDLMIHDLDLVLTMLDCPITRIEAVGVPLASAHADMASARLCFANGSTASLTASRIAERTERRMRLFERGRSIALDFSSRSLSVIARSAEGAPLAGAPDFRLLESRWEEHDSLAAEHAAFRAAIRGQAPVVVDAAAGTRALAAALGIAEAISTDSSGFVPAA
ncbi:MAG: Gfo/Idh/MocA family protein [Acetobacteraceae bacterium]